MRKVFVSHLGMLMGGGIGYLAGSIPWGILIPRYMKKGDPRQVGSGNIGASNVFRLAGFFPAFLVFVGDFLKGYVPVFLYWGLAGQMPYMAELVGLCTILGHLFPLWLRGRGGKGVSVAFGVMAALFWKVALLIMVIWAVVWWWKRYASLASLVSFSVGIGVLWRHAVGMKKLFLAGVLLLIFWSHRHNLIRLFMNMEHKIEKEKKG